MKKSVLALLLTVVSTLTSCRTSSVDSVMTVEKRAGGSTVVEGATEPDYKYPWVVVLGGCRGVLVDPGWVLTAAHCVTPGFWSGKLSYQRTDPWTGTVSTEERTVNLMNSVFRHPDYQPGGGFDSPENDIALLRLEQPFTIEPGIQTVAVPGAPRVVGRTGTIAGFSHTSMLPPGYFAVLRAQIPAQAPPGCTPPAGAFCIRSDTAALCPGDSGSGFVTIENGRATVTGVASYARATDCDTVGPNDYAGLTDVFSYRDWILSTMSMTAGTLAGNTRVRRSGGAARGVIGVGCTNPYSTMWGPANVAGVQLGANCAAGETQSVVCSLNGGAIGGFTMRTTHANGTVSVQALPFGNSFAGYYGVLPAGVEREFTCEVARTDRSRLVRAVSAQ